MRIQLFLEGRGGRTIKLRLIKYRLNKINSQVANINETIRTI